MNALSMSMVAHFWLIGLLPDSTHASKITPANLASPFYYLQTSLKLSPAQDWVKLRVSSIFEGLSYNTRGVCAFIAFRTSSVPCLAGGIPCLRFHLGAHVLVRVFHCFSKWREASFRLAACFSSATSDFARLPQVDRAGGLISVSRPEFPFSSASSSEAAAYLKGAL